MLSEKKLKSEFAEMSGRLIWRKKIIKTEEIIEIYSPYTGSMDERTIQIERDYPTLTTFPISSAAESDDSLRILDEENRLQVAKMIGLDRIPEIDPNAIDESSGILDHLFEDEEETDSVKLVKNMRMSRKWR